MKNSRTRMYVQNGRKGLDLYLDVNGEDHYLVTRRPNSYIWQMLKDGATLEELRRIKPTKNKAGQRYYHSVSYMLKIADEFIKHELSA